MTEIYLFCKKHGRKVLLKELLLKTAYWHPNIIGDCGCIFALSLEVRNLTAEKERDAELKEKYKNVKVHMLQDGTILEDE